VTYTCFKLDALTPSLWRTTFNNPPINLLSGTGTSIALFQMESSSPLCTASLVGSRPSIVRLWPIFVNKVSLPDKEEFPPQLDAFMRAAAGPGLQARARKAVDQGFQARSDVELRLAEFIGEVPEAESLPGEQSRREGERR
jgi:hypothetical protein